MRFNSLFLTLALFTSVGCSQWFPHFYGQQNGGSGEAPAEDPTPAPAPLSD